MRASARALLLVLAVALVACGGDATARYRSGAENAANDFREAAEPVLDQVRGAPSARSRIGALEAFRATVNKAAGDFSRLDPPDKAKRDNALLVGQFRGLSRDVVRYEAVLRSGDRGAQARLSATVESDFVAIERTSARISASVGA